MPELGQGSLTDDVEYTPGDRKGPSRGKGTSRLKITAVVLVFLAVIVVLGNAMGLFDRFKSGSEVTNPNGQLTAEDRAEIERQMQEQKMREQTNDGFREDMIPGDQ